MTMGSEPVEQPLTRGFLMHARGDLSVLVLGNLHWYFRHRNEGYKIMVFDSVSESFQWMRHADIPGWLFIFKMDDTLVFSAVEKTIICSHYMLPGPPLLAPCNCSIGEFAMLLTDPWVCELSCGLGGGPAVGSSQPFAVDLSADAATSPMTVANQQVSPPAPPAVMESPFVVVAVAAEFAAVVAAVAAEFAVVVAAAAAAAGFAAIAAAAVGSVETVAGVAFAVVASASNYLLASLVDP
ncbi:hypothetical protein E2562_017744 [Oryza meyeriana var. granulata]|uniref:Uncharacterized protein n=1 Tax=Oryza meyeriana var. granulata TaxID=110450 RepID=A0A6G1BYD1_9ORYZ|nr:hypothetical protein E2562_017744 [Oryza meyeriana var. granulata]